MASAALAPGVALAGPPRPAGAAPPMPVGPRVASADLRPTIRPRADWAGDLEPTGPLTPEDDVRFLLVHHTASTNDYGPDEVADQIRGFYEFHTGPEKKWPDVAYNFFVDRHGGIWEGRQGSLEGPVRGDATGGSQGFALLCSLIGDFQAAPMTDVQHASLVQLLAWLGESYGVDTHPGATVGFTSRGSNRWPAGTEVTAATISGHRDLSMTTCPGDYAYPLLAEQLPMEVTALRASVGATIPSDTAGTVDDGAGDERAVPATSAADGDPALESTTTSPPAAPATTATTVSDGIGTEAAAGPDGGRDAGGVSDRTLLVGGVAAAGVGVAATAARSLAARRRLALGYDDDYDGEG